MILSTDTTVEYVIQNRKTKLFYGGGRAGYCTVRMIEDAEKYASKREALGACSIYEGEAVFALTTTTTVTLSDNEENPFE